MQIIRGIIVLFVLATTSPMVQGSNEKIFSYRIKNYPVALEQCQPVANTIATQFAAQTARDVLSASCEKTLARKVDILINYAAESELTPISTFNELALGQGSYASKEICEASLAGQVQAFETHTGLHHLVAFCYAEGSSKDYSHPFVMRIDGFGAPRLHPVVSKFSIYGKPLNIERILQQVQDALTTMGLQAPQVVVSAAQGSYEVTVKYYAARPAPIALLQYTAYQSGADCAQYAREVFDLLSEVQSIPMSMFCAAQHFDASMDLYTLVHVQGSHEVEKQPTRYIDLAACNADKDRVTQFYRERMHKNAAGALCYYQRPLLLDPEGFYMKVLITP